MRPSVVHQHLHFVNEAESPLLVSLLVSVPCLLPFKYPPTHYPNFESGCSHPSKNAIAPKTHKYNSFREPPIVTMDYIVRWTIVPNTHIGVQPNTFCLRERVIGMYEEAFRPFEVICSKAVRYAAEAKGSRVIERTCVHDDHPIPATRYRHRSAAFHSSPRFS